MKDLALQAKFLLKTQTGRHDEQTAPEHIIAFTMSPSTGHRQYFNTDMRHDWFGVLTKYSVTKAVIFTTYTRVLPSYHCLHIHIAQPGPVTSLQPPASPELQTDSSRPAGTTHRKKEVQTQLVHVQTFPQ